MRRILLATGGLAMIGLAGVLVWGNFEHGNTIDDRESLHGPVARIAVDLPAGELRIERSATGEAEVHRTVRYHGDRPGRTFEFDRGTLRLRGCQDCTVDYRVLVPPGVAVDGKLGAGGASVRGAGDVRLTGDAGDLRFQQVRSLRVHAGSGEVSARRVSAAARVTADHGDVRLAGVGGDADIRAGSGGVSVERMGAAVRIRDGSGDIHVGSVAAADVEARTGAGDVTVRVPRGTAYRVRVRGGDTGVRVPNEPDAPNILAAGSDTGDVHVLAG